ncbi:putative head structural protein [Mycobacterium phage CASbig]|uniref:putative head structural protein n=1 Tax=Mycobacterium phage CASbig TaxID=1327035 RepID=UPI00032B8FAD|nr:putative head structural protein [Mycobacterium phage CASbig]AGK88147.1 putative head structural protein [Mycobacterium phage CASbig]
MNPAGLYTKLQGDLAYAIGRGIDLAVFHGKSPLTGSALQGIDTNNVIANTTNVDYLQTGSSPLLDRFLDGYDLVSANTDVDFNGWAADPRYRARLLRSQAYRDANGNVDPTRINLAAATGDLLGLPVQFGKAVGGDLGAATDSKVRVVGGDFSQLKYGFADEIRVKMSDTATLTDNTSPTPQTVSMWQTNQIAILIEVTFGWLLGDKQAFIKFVDDEKPGDD